MGKVESDNQTQEYKNCNSAKTILFIKKKNLKRATVLNMEAIFLISLYLITLGQ